MGTSIGEIWSDLDHRLIQDSKGIKRAINVEAVFSSIDNIIRTAPYERVMLPEFGSGMESMVFENMNSALMTFISRQISTSIERWDDRVSVNGIKFVSNPDANEVSAVISFSIRAQPTIYTYVKPIKIAY